MPFEIEVGGKILFGKYFRFRGQDVGQEPLIMREDEILAILN